MRISRDWVDKVRAVAQPILILAAAYIGLAFDSLQLTVLSVIMLLIYVSYTFAWLEWAEGYLKSVSFTPPSTPVMQGYEMSLNLPEGISFKAYSSRHVRQNGNMLKFVWSGVAKIAALRVEAYDRFTGIKVSRLIRVNARILIMPKGWSPGEGVGLNPGEERGLEEFLGLVEYSFDRPASMIHWPSSARSGSLMAKEYGEESWRITVALPIRPILLTPIGDLRPIDRVLSALSYVTRTHGPIRVLLIYRDNVDEVVVTDETVPTVEERILENFTWAIDRGEVARLSRLSGLSQEEALEITYPRLDSIEDYPVSIPAGANLVIVPKEYSMAPEQSNVLVV